MSDIPENIKRKIAYENLEKLIYGEKNG